MGLGEGHGAGRRVLMGLLLAFIGVGWLCACGGYLAGAYLERNRKDGDR